MENFTSGVAQKERNSLCGLGPHKGDNTWKLPQRTMWIFFFFYKPRESDEAGPWNIVRERMRGYAFAGFMWIVCIVYKPSVMCNSKCAILHNPAAVQKVVISKIIIIIFNNTSWLVPTCSSNISGLSEAWT